MCLPKVCTLVAIPTPGLRAKGGVNIFGRGPFACTSPLRRKSPSHLCTTGSGYLCLCSPPSPPRRRLYRRQRSLLRTSPRFTHNLPALRPVTHSRLSGEFINSRLTLYWDIMLGDFYLFFSVLGKVANLGVIYLYSYRTNH